MLLEFSVKNFRSFGDKQTFKFYAKDKGNISGSTMNTKYKGQENKTKTERIYKTNVIYGLNNSGKTNLIKCLNIISGAVEQSKKNGLPKKNDYFLLKKEFKNEPSFFEIKFIGEDKIKYEYSFSINEERVVNEKLIAEPNGQSKIYYEREYVREKNDYDWKYDNLKGYKNNQIERIIADTKQDCLLLSASNDVANENLQPVYKFISNITIGMQDRINMLDFYDKKVIDILLSENKEKDLFIKIFKILITNGKNEEMADIYLEKEELTNRDKNMLEKILEKTPIDKAEKTKSDFEKYNFNSVKIKRMQNDGNIVQFDLEKHESGGTNRFLNILSFLFEKKDIGGVFIFDELDSQLHPKLIIFLLKIIYHFNWKIQLVFTAHNTSFMKKNFNVFRKHQIWFCDKDFKQQTILYTAGENNIRKEKDLENLYYNGRFGAMLNDSLWDEIENIYKSGDNNGENSEKSN